MKPKKKKKMNLNKKNKWKKFSILHWYVFVMSRSEEQSIQWEWKWKECDLVNAHVSQKKCLESWMLHFSRIKKKMKKMDAPVLVLLFFPSFHSSSSLNPYGSPPIIRIGVWVVSIGPCVFSILWMKWRQSIEFRKVLRLLHPHRQYILIFQVCATEYGKTLEKSYTFAWTKLHIHHIIHCK